MIKKCRQSDGFTILELMVSIFVTITVIASFYKLYESSVKTERSSSIRVSVNLLGEQILDSISDSIQMVGLNSQKSDLTASSYINGIFPQAKLGVADNDANAVEFKYVSPYGSPITKVASQPSDTQSATLMFSDEGCKTITLFNSAAFHGAAKKFYFHTQYGILVTNNQTTVVIGDNNITLEVSGFETDTTSLAGKDCKDVIPAGTLVTGEDFIYTLTYSSYGSDSDNSLVLAYKNKNNTASGKVVDFHYDPDGTNGANDLYSMPHFVLQFLTETKNSVSGEGDSDEGDSDEGDSDESDKYTRTWVTSVDYADIKKVIAVRFGFVILSKKERVYQGNASPTGTDVKLPTYCVFDETECYTLPSLNYTASVFRRVVYLANFRLLKDSANM